MLGGVFHSKIFIKSRSCYFYMVIYRQVPELTEDLVILLPVLVSHQWTFLGNYVIV